MENKEKKHCAITNKLCIWYLPMAFLILYGLMLSKNEELWANVLRLLAIIVTTLTLIPIIRAKTANIRTVFFFTSGIFVFGIEVIIWIIQKYLFDQNQGDSVLLSYLHIVPNLCFVIGIIVFIYVNKSNWHPVQLILDLITASLLTVGTLAIMFFDIQIYGHLAGHNYINNFVFLALDSIAISAMITDQISSRSKKIQKSHLIIFGAFIILYLADSFYTADLMQNHYIPYDWINWLYMASILLIASGFKCGYVTYLSESQLQKEQIFLNEGPIWYAWWMLIPPVLVFIFHGFQIKDLVFYVSTVVFYLFASLYIQGNISMERLLKERTAINKKLQVLVTERTQQLHSTNEHLIFLLQNDALTGLFNRDYLMDLIDEYILKHVQGMQLNLIIIDIDKFRFINEIYGYNIGDEVLKKTAEHLKNFGDDFSCSARIDGNEFAILYYSNQGIEHIQNEIEKLIFELGKSMKISPFEISINIHVGIATYPENAKNRAELLKCAKRALQEAKLKKINTCLNYDKSIHEKEMRKQKIEIALRKSNIEIEFEVFYQPQFNLANNTMFGAEALLRWDSPTLGKVGPDEFIFVAEETGLIFRLGDWVMKKSMQQITKWNAKFDYELIVSINISPIQLEDNNFIERVLELIAETGVSPKWINFEITESSTIESKDEFLSVLTRLSEIGISFAIDDFGTGYSTYGYLKRFPIDYLKIDKQLIDTITSVPKDARVVRAIIAMAKAFKINTVAEGAETKEQVELLRKIGCNSVQGYYFGKPVSANEFEQKYFEEQELDEEIVNSH